MMFELLGLLLGSGSRLAQHWLDLKDKDKERDHEHRMLEKQIEIQDKRLAHDSEMRRVDADSASEAAEWAAMTAAIESQAREAQSVGGFVAKLSASVRPVLSYWFVAIYTASKAATLYLAMSGGAKFAEAIAAAYTTFDGTILASIVSFYFADRSLRKK